MLLSSCSTEFSYSLQRFIPPEKGKVLTLPHYFRSKMAEPIPPITLPSAQNPQQEAEWLRANLHHWLDQEFIPEVVNQQIANRAAQIYARQRMEGENDLGSLVIAIVTEMQAFDFSQSFYSEFAIANAVSDILLDSLGIDRCCGQ